MIENFKVERKLYNGVGKIKPLNLGNFSPLLTREKNMPPTIFLIQNIAGTSENFSLNPCIFVKKNSNKHFIVTYFSTKIGREINKSFPGFRYLITRPEDYPFRRFIDDQYITASESKGSFLNNNISELENGILLRRIVFWYEL